jgi:hypothetical protein
MQPRVEETLPERPNWLFPRGYQIAVLQRNSAVHQPLGGGGEMSKECGSIKKCLGQVTGVFPPN